MGTIRQRGDKYQAIVKRQEFGTASKSFTTHKDALAWVRAKEAAMDRGEPLRVEKPIVFTLAIGLARYRDTITPGKKGAKTEFYRIGKWLADPLAEKQIDTITAVDFASWRDMRLMQVSGATVNRELSLVSAVLDVARQEWGFIALRNPIRDIRKPPPQGKARCRHISEAEQAALWRLDPAPNVTRTPDCFARKRTPNSPLGGVGIFYIEPVASEIPKPNIYLTF